MVFFFNIFKMIYFSCDGQDALNVSKISVKTFKMLQK